MRKVVIFLSIFIGIFYFLSQTETFKYFKEQSIDKVNPKFNLVDMDNKPFSDKDLLGKRYIVGFGYTNCIDICPVTLATLTGMLEVLEEKYGKEYAQNYNAVFITIDPNRDSPEILSDYIKGIFHDRIIALTGSQKNIDKMGKNFRIEYSKYGDIENNLYTMIHPIYLYVIDEKGEYKMQIAHTIKPELAIDLIIKKLGK